MAQSGSILGNSVLRKEDPGLLTGANEYFDDLKVDGLTHIVFVRSHVAHARLGAIDTAEAKTMPGVLAVYTADDLNLPDNVGFAGAPDHKRPPLARGKVRFVGDIVAAVVATDPYVAADAAEAVVVDYDPLPAVIDLEESLGGATLLFEDKDTNVCFVTAHGADLDALEGADVVAEARILSQRLAGVPMEANGCVAIPEGEGLRFYVSNQAPHGVHAGLIADLGLEAEQLRVICPWVGGGFGPKAGLYVEYILTAAAARALGRPVKWTETRSENLVSMVHGRSFIMDAKLGVTSEGKIVGLEARVIADGGAYAQVGIVLPMLTQMMSQAVYDIPKINFDAKTVLTNTTSIGPYRGVGRPEAAQMVERIMDVAADLLGMDPAELRRRNYLQPSQFPYSTATGANYDSGEYEKTLDAALAASGYTDLRREQEERRKNNDSRQLGIGVSTYVEITAPLGLFEEFGSVTVEEDGTVTARAGTSAHGQGHDTAFSMIISDVLGVPMDKVRLVQSDTAEVPRGAGTMGSRSLQTAGSALHTASGVVMDKARKLAAHLLEANEDDIVKGDDGLQVAGVPAKALSWAELAKAANDPNKHPFGADEAGLTHELDFSEGDSTFPFGSHVAVVEVDLETGGVTMLRHIAVDDCGRILNPMLVAGQQHGGIAQGAAQALFEHVQYDADGNPTSGTLMDYLMPSAAELPSFEASNTQTDSPRNPLGAKGIGESGTIGSTPAVHNAVVDALSHLGVTHVDMPCTPEKVWRAIEGASGTAAA